MNDRFAKKQHYIPQFYLKNFSSDKKHLHVYDRLLGEKGDLRYQTTIDIAHQNNFYTFQTKQGGKKNLENFFSQLEGDASLIIDKVYKKYKISLEEMEKIALFVAFLHTRVPAFKRTTEQIHTSAGEKLLRLKAKTTSKEQLRKFYREKESKELTDQELDNIIDFAVNPKRSRIGFTYPNGYWIKTLLEMGVEFAQYFFEMDWIFLFTEKPYAFITSDNPFILIPPKNYNPLRSFGLLTPGTKKIIPLRPDMCLMMNDRKENTTIRFGVAHKDFYRGVNTRLMVESERFCFSSERGKLEKLAKETKSCSTKEKNVMIVE